MTTDEQGRFEFSRLPADAIAWLSISHKTYADQHLYAATLDSRTVTSSAYNINDGKLLSLPRDRDEEVSVSPLQISVTATNMLVVRIVDAKNQPVADIPIHAGSGGRATGTHASSKTDTNGRANLALPPGDYRVFARAPRDSKYVSTSGNATIVADKALTNCELKIEAGCKLILTAIDADTREPIVGVPLWEEQSDGRSDYHQLQRHPSYISNDCRTDDKGEASAIVRPGTRKYGIGYIPYPPPYSGSGATGLSVECLAGETVRATLELHTPTPEERSELNKSLFGVAK